MNQNIMNQFPERLINTAHKMKFFIKGFMAKVPIIKKPVLCSSNQWTGFYMVGSSVMKELRVSSANVTEPLM